MRKRPHCSGPMEREVTREPLWVYSGRPLTRLPQPASAICDELRRGALDDGDELDEARPDLVAEVAIDLATAVTVEGMDRAEDVGLGSGRLQQPGRPQDLGVRGRAALVHALGIVDLRRAIHGEADQEAVLREEGRPGLVEERAVGLDGVLDDLAGPAVALHELQQAAEEVEAHERRLAALPGDGHVLRAVRLEQLADVLVQDPVLHAEGTARVEGLLGEEEAVRAVEVADGAARLDEHVEGRRGAGRQGVRQHGQEPGTRGIRPVAAAEPGGAPVTTPCRLKARAEIHHRRVAPTSPPVPEGAQPPAPGRRCAPHGQRPHPRAG